MSPMVRKVNQDFFKTWTSDMAYIAGFLFADGNIVLSKRGTHFVAIYAADRPLLVAIKKCWESEHKISVQLSDTGRVYRIQVGSKEWFSDLGKLGLFPNKTKRLTLPNLPRNFFGDFVRGYFDGDGNVWSGFINKKRKTPTRILQAVFTSGSRGFLEELLRMLQQNEIRGGSLYIPKTGNYTRLILSSNDALKLYEIMYNTPHKLYLKRKKIVFEEFMKLRL